jgi:hypothetical protein
VKADRTCREEAATADSAENRALDIIIVHRLDTLEEEVVLLEVVLPEEIQGFLAEEAMEVTIGVGTGVTEMIGAATMIETAMIASVDLEEQAKAVLPLEILMIQVILMTMEALEVDGEAAEALLLDRLLVCLHSLLLTKTCNLHLLSG